MSYSVLPYTEETVVVMANGREIGICADNEDAVKALLESLK